MDFNWELVFRGGLIKNGILKGNNTKIKHRGNIIFDHVEIKGSWDVPEISGKMFKDLSYDNALRNVVALTNPKVHNRITIEEGEYPISVQRASETCLLLQSNTDFFLKGTIRLKPNSFKSYDIIKVEGDNITISGGGVIIGDKFNHLGTVGEWGMGIEFNGAHNATLSYLTVKDCWGDCIYVGGDSRNVTIENCVIDNGRRQGISVTKADGVFIRNCTISNIGGTDPEYAIDVEPNNDCTVDHVLIENVVVENCVGGFVVSKGNRNVDLKRIGEVIIRECTVRAIRKCPIRFERCEKAIVEDCTVYDNQEYPPISSIRSTEVVIQNNRIIKQPTIGLKRGNKQFVQVLWTEEQVVSDNIILERE